MSDEPAIGVRYRESLVVVRKNLFRILVRAVSHQVCKRDWHIPQPAFDLPILVNGLHLTGTIENDVYVLIRRSWGEKLAVNAVKIHGLMGYILNCPRLKHRLYIHPLSPQFVPSRCPFILSGIMDFLFIYDTGFFSFVHSENSVASIY